MATARAVIGGYTVVDLREFAGADLAEVLDEQSACWRRRFQWDYSDSQRIILNFLDARTLYGFALLAAGRPVGYCYFLAEEPKALLGDFYILDACRDADAERMLLAKTIETAALYPGVRRIEGQLLALTIGPEELVVFQRRVESFPRLYMVLDELSSRRPEPEPAPRFDYRPWTDYSLDAAADLITSAYQGHVDGRINDQYRGFNGARRFLYNTTRRPGCGEFLPGASILASPPSACRLSGLCLGSRVAAAAGHVTQLCVAPAERRRGLGRELMRRSLAGFRAAGCEAVSLTVTAANRDATPMYERMGFRVSHSFSAFVWEPD